MVGILIITHADIGKELIKASQMILGAQENVEYISIEANTNEEEVMDKMNATLKRFSKGGILILTDMFGGTPMNIGCRFLGRYENLEVVTGVNLALVVKALIMREKIKDVKELAGIVADYARKDICVAGSILQGISG